MSGNSVIRPGRRHSTTVSTSEAVLEYAKKSGMKVPDKIAAAIQLHSQHQSYGADEDSQFHLSFASTISKIHLWAYNGKVDQIKLAIAKYPELLKHKFLFTDKELLTPEEQQDDSFIPPAQLPTTVRAAVQAAVACNGRLDKLPIDQRWLMAYSFSNSTLLHYAVVGNQKEVLELLLAKGADTTITNSHKKTAEYYAATSDIRDTLWNAPKFRANEASNSKMNAAPVNISSISITNTNLSGNNGSNAISRDVLSPTSSKNGPRRNSILDLKKKNLDMISNQTKILMVNINSRSSINHKADDEKSVVSALSTSTITTKSSIRRLSRVLGARKLRAVQEKTQQENRKSISAMLFNNDNSSSVKDGKPFRTVDGSVAYTKPIDDTISVSVAENSSVRTMRMKRLSIAEGSNTIVSKTYEVSGEQHTISEVSPEAEEKSLLKLATANEKPPVGPSALKKVQPPPTTLNKANPMNKELTESLEYLEVWERNAVTAATQGKEPTAAGIIGKAMFQYDEKMAQGAQEAAKLLAKAKELEKEEQRKVARRNSVIRMYNQLKPIETVASATLEDMKLDNKHVMKSYMQAIFNEEEQLLEVPEDAHSKSTAFTLSNFTPKGKSKVSSNSMNSSSAADKKRQGKSDTIDLITALNLNKEVDLHKLTYKDMLWTKAGQHIRQAVADSSKSSYNQMRTEAYNLGIQILKSEFKLYAVRDNWEAVDFLKVKEDNERRKHAGREDFEQTAESLLPAFAARGEGPHKDKGKQVTRNTKGRSSNRTESDENDRRSNGMRRYSFGSYSTYTMGSDSDYSDEDDDSEDDDEYDDDDDDEEEEDEEDEDDDEVTSMPESSNKALSNGDKNKMDSAKVFRRLTKIMAATVLDNSGFDMDDENMDEKRREEKIQEMIAYLGSQFIK